MGKLRLHKYLSQAGICSRRKAEEYIRNGFVLVNGEIASIGQIIDSDIDKIKLLDNIIEDKKNLVYYKIYKPRGIITTCAEYGEKNIIDIIDIKERVFPIGRLDKNSEGLILLTNDGRLANYLMHPKYEHSKEYIVETFGAINDKQFLDLQNPMKILGDYIRPIILNRISSGKLSIVLTQGKNRQIRRMIESIGSQVKKLKRIRIENILLGDLKSGEYKELTKSEKDILFKKLNLN